MPADLSASLQSLVTKTATFQSAGYNIPTGTPKRGLWAKFSFASLQGVGTAGGVFTPSIEHSDDNTTFTTLVSAPGITLATAANTTQPPSVLKVFTKKPYIRAVLTQTTASGTPSIVYQADIVAADS